MALTCVVPCVFVFSGTQNALPLRASIPVANAFVILPLEHIRAHDLPKNLYIKSMVLCVLTIAF